jgi:hypothetical protein
MLSLLVVGGVLNGCGGDAQPQHSTARAPDHGAGVSTETAKTGTTTSGSSRQSETASAPPQIAAPSTHNVGQPACPSLTPLVRVFKPEFKQLGLGKFGFCYFGRTDATALVLSVVSPTNRIKASVIAQVCKKATQETRSKVTDAIAGGRPARIVPVPALGADSFVAAFLNTHDLFGYSATWMEGTACVILAYTPTSGGIGDLDRFAELASAVSAKL